MKKGFTKTRHSDEQSEEESNKRNRSFAVAQDDGVRQGFTLVELSIVLVIIGLLVGGLLVGQSMIKAANVGKLASEFNEYEVAVRLFESQFGGLPGDIAKGQTFFGTECGPNQASTCSGNGDGRVDIQTSPGSYFEAINAWQHLEMGGMLDLDLDYSAITGWQWFWLIPGQSLPKSFYHDQAGYVIVGISNSNGVGLASWVDEPHPIGLYLGRYEASSAPSIDQYGIVKPSIALALDVKIDDGNIRAGKFVSARNHLAPNNCSISADTEYNLAYTEDIDGCRVFMAFD